MTEELFKTNLVSIKGVVERITFQNEENGYVVARLKPEDRPYQLVTVVGNMPSVSVGETLAIYGHWKSHSKYGDQFSIQSYETLMPATVEGIKKYLGSGLIKGVGPVTAQRIVRTFGLSTLDVIEGDPEKLLEVGGIGRKRVDMIVGAWADQKEIKNVMIFLQQHGVSVTYAVKIYKEYGNSAIGVVKNNPYRLATDIWGIGFKTADRIAASLGIAKDSPYRIMAGVRFVLGEATGDGHIYLPQDELEEKTGEALEVDAALVPRILAELDKGGEVFIEEDRVYLASLYYAETGVAEGLKRIIATKAKFTIPDIEERIEGLEQSGNIAFSDKQREAIRTTLSNKATVLTGGPGTGKTTTILGIINLLREAQIAITLAAPTGRAAKRMSEITGAEAKTIHRLLEFSPANGKFKRNREFPLEAEVVLIDEASMVDVVLMNNLLKAIAPTSFLILVGDVDQLPPVGAGNALKDIINSGIVKVITLDVIFRQARKSLIVMSAHRINQGDYPIFKNQDEDDFFFIEEDDAEKIPTLVRDLCIERLPDYYDVDAVEDIQVICPTNRGRVGSAFLNQMLQDALHPPSGTSRKDESLSRGNRNLYMGDKVIQLRNNYDKNVFNGDIGRVVKIDLEDQLVRIRFDDRLVDYDFSDLDEVSLAYAISVHRSQGSEYQVVVFPLVTQHYMLLQRSLVYTGITRAKRAVVMVGMKKALWMAIKNDSVQKRYTTLAERLRAADRF